MRIISAEVQNFGSYGNLEFIFDQQGLSLLSGPTGAGKSTLCDVIPWILFGVTSKNGTVDEIRSWNTDEPTYGSLIFEHNGKVMHVCRIRGKQNDLFFSKEPINIIRGKDLNDTQKLLNDELGVNADLYLSGAYFHEFSQTANFFTAQAKTRRQLIEQLVDLNLASTLNKNISEYKKNMKKERDELQTKVSSITSTAEYIKGLIINATDKAATWKITQKARIEKLEHQHSNFDKDQTKKIKKIQASSDMFGHNIIGEIAGVEFKIQDIEKVLKPISYFQNEKDKIEVKISALGEEKCKSCGNTLNSDRKIAYIRHLSDWNTEESKNNVLANEVRLLKFDLRRLKAAQNPYSEHLEQETLRENTYSIQLDEARKEANPYDQIITDNQNKLKEIKATISELSKDVSFLSLELSDSELLSDVVDSFRAILVKNTIRDLQYNTNRMLTDFFDAELRVEFNVESSDKLDVSITKDGNSCSYTQLSKGQRQLLRLCFGVSVMRTVSNHNGISFNSIFLDEPFDGMDESLKTKGFRLLESLSSQYESVFIIDHSESLKIMFNKRYDISLVNGNSQIVENN